MNVADILETLENATLAELLEELDLVNQYEDNYPKYFKHLLLSELAKRNENKKEPEN